MTLTVPFVLGIYALVGCFFASWAFLLYGRDESQFSPAMNGLIFLIYCLLWPVGLWLDWRKFLRNLLGRR